MSNRASVGIEQLEEQVPGMVESLLKELLVEHWLVRAGGMVFSDQWLAVEGIGRSLLAAQLVPVKGCACRSLCPDWDLRLFDSSPLTELGAANCLKDCFWVCPKLTESSAEAALPTELVAPDDCRFGGLVFHTCRQLGIHASISAGDFFGVATCCGIYPRPEVWVLEQAPSLNLYLHEAVSLWGVVVLCARRGARNHSRSAGRWHCKISIVLETQEN